MKKIGVLALQGAVSEHMNMIREAGAMPCEVKYVKEFDDIDGMIIPGGESTAIGRLLRDYNLIEPLRKKIENGLAVWGTCAGMILLAKEIDGDDTKHLAVMDICVKRNAYGRQLDSFTTEESVPEVSNSKIPLVFIRAPYVVRAEKNVKILLKVRGNIVACRQNRMLATSFHPELTGNLDFHRYFINEVCK